MTSSGLLAFTYAFYNKPNLKSLELGGFQEVNDKANITIFDSLINALNINQLKVSSTQLNENTIKALGNCLSKLRNLKYIDLQYNKITKEEQK